MRAQRIFSLDVGARRVASHLVSMIHRLFQRNCKEGCPCDSFECNELTTTQALTTTAQPTEKAVLVLSTKDSRNMPMVIDFEGSTRTINIHYYIVLKILL